MDKMQAVPVPTTVQELLSSGVPTRIAILVRARSPLFANTPDEMVKVACATLNIPDSSHPTLLAIEKWDRHTALAFDVCHDTYDSFTAHHEADLPVVLVDYGKRYSVVKAAGHDFQKRVNRTVAREHDLNGWDARPPYISDHTEKKIPTYPNPRHMITLRPESPVQPS